MISLISNKKVTLKVNPTSHLLLNVCIIISSVLVATNDYIKAYAALTINLRKDLYIIYCRQQHLINDANNTPSTQNSVHEFSHGPIQNFILAKANPLLLTSKTPRKKIINRYLFKIYNPQVSFSTKLNCFYYLGFIYSFY